MSTFPSLFISHGSPDLAIRNTAAKAFLAEYGRMLGKPAAILVLSAHFEADQPTITTDSRPGTVHDFRGFPAELYQMAYPAPGAPELARDIGRRLKAAGFTPVSTDKRGFDHGIWIPLMLLYPEADIPVAQLSVSPDESPDFHHRMGAALKPLRDEGVLIIGSGSLTHNLRAVFKGGLDETSQTPGWVREFRDWVVEKAGEGDAEALLAYMDTAPHARENHPTEEHFLPFFFALGASADGHGKAVHSSYDYGALAMDAIAFN